MSLTGKIIRVSGPLMLAMSGYATMMIVDRISLALYSEDSLAAFGPAVFASMTLTTFGTGFVFSMQAYMAASVVDEAEGKAECSRRFLETLMMAAFVTGVIACLFPVIIVLTHYSGRPGGVLQLERDYLVVAWIFTPVIIFNTAWNCYYTALGRTVEVFQNNLAGQVVSVLASVSLIFGFWIMPELGILGSALGTLIGVSVTQILYITRSRRFALGYSIAWIRGHSRTLRNRLNKGIFVGLTDASDEAGNTAIMWATGMLGASALAANNYNIILNWISILPIIGLGDGANALVAKECGARRHANVWAILTTTIVLSLTYASVVTGSLFVFSEALANLFELDRYAAGVWLKAVSVTEILWIYALAFSLSYPTARVLQACDMSSFVLKVRLGIMFGCSVPVAFWLAHTFQNDALAVVNIWISLSLCELLVGAILYLRFLAWWRRSNSLVIRSLVRG